MNELPNAIQLLTWDSEFLGYLVARLVMDTLSPEEITVAIKGAKQAGIRLLYGIDGSSLTKFNDVLQQQGAWLADQKTTFVMSVSARILDATTLPPNIRPTTVYTPQLESLAWQSGEYSRFRIDPRFDAGVFRQLYSHWLRNSLAGTIAQRVLVWYSAEGQELGLLTLGEKKQRADIGLLAVDASARGQRIGQQLIVAAQAWAVNKGFTELQVVTQGYNLPACAFYTKCGFEPVHVEQIYHLWLS
jgi:dTDP-4-amino-4,6-dideoxy-D-galactose acyltransferase